MAGRDRQLEHSILGELAGPSGCWCPRIFRLHAEQVAQWGRPTCRTNLSSTPLPLERSVVEFGIGIGDYEGVVRVPRRVFQVLLPEAPTPERCLEAYHLHRTRFESIAERKLRRRQLTEDGNVEITGPDFR